jgi:hypothetical protein
MNNPGIPVGANGAPREYLGYNAIGVNQRLMEAVNLDTIDILCVLLLRFENKENGKEARLIKTMGKLGELIKDVQTFKSEREARSIAVAYSILCQPKAESLRAEIGASFATNPYKGYAPRVLDTMLKGALTYTLQDACVGEALRGFLTEEDTKELIGAWETSLRCSGKLKACDEEIQELFKHLTLSKETPIGELVDACVSLNNAESLARRVFKELYPGWDGSTLDLTNTCIDAARCGAS